MAKKNDSKGNDRFLEPLSIAWGFILSQLFLFVLSAILATIVYFSSWQASPRVLSLLAHLGVLGGAIVAGCRCRKRAWLHGIVVGIASFLVFSWVGYGEPLFATWAWWNALLKMAIVAMLGGIFGGLFGS